MDTIDISIAAEALGLNHDTYSALLMADIRRLIETGVHPPAKRSSMMEPVSRKEGIYWRLKQ